MLIGEIRGEGGIRRAGRLRPDPLQAVAVADEVEAPRATGPDAPGAIDPQRLAKLQDFYLAKGIIQKKSPLDDLYTNQFVK